MRGGKRAKAALTPAQLHALHLETFLPKFPTEVALYLVNSMDASTRLVLACCSRACRSALKSPLAWERVRMETLTHKYLKPMSFEAYVRWLDAIDLQRDLAFGIGLARAERRFANIGKAQLFDISGYDAIDESHFAPEYLIRYLRAFKTVRLYGSNFFVPPVGTDVRLVSRGDRAAWKDGHDGQCAFQLLHRQALMETLACEDAERLETDAVVYSLAEARTWASCDWAHVRLFLYPLQYLVDESGESVCYPFKDKPVTFQPCWQDEAEPQQLRELVDAYRAAGHPDARLEPLSINEQPAGSDSRPRPDIVLEPPRTSLRATLC
jgi:hypothetical protein